MGEEEGYYTTGSIPAFLTHDNNKTTVLSDLLLLSNLSKALYRSNITEIAPYVHTYL